MNEFQVIQLRRLEFALVLARESGKLHQQAQEAISPKFCDRLRADADREFERATQIVKEVVGSGNQASQEHAATTGRSAAPK
jgi:hypothetical protein